MPVTIFGIYGFALNLIIGLGMKLVTAGFCGGMWMITFIGLILLAVFA